MNKKINQQNTKYYVHIVEPENFDSNLVYIPLDQFAKKRKQNYKEDILINDLLEYFFYNDSKQVLFDIVTKLKKDARLHIQGIDARSVANNFVNDLMDLEIFNMLMYGYGKKQVLSFSKIKYLLDSIPDIRIENIRFINGINYYIECIKL